MNINVKLKVKDHYIEISGKIYGEEYNYSVTFLPGKVDVNKLIEQSLDQLKEEINARAPSRKG